MVNKSYMLATKPAASEVKLFVDQRLIPVGINLAGSVEGLLERVAVRARQRPATAVGATFATAMLLSMLTRRLLRPTFL